MSPASRPILSRWHEGHVKLTELITKKNVLDEINDGYQDLMDGKNIRGVVVLLTPGGATPRTPRGAPDGSAIARGRAQQQRG